VDLGWAQPEQRTRQATMTAALGFLTQTKVFTLTFQPPKLARSPLRTQIEQQQIRPIAAGHDPGKSAVAEAQAIPPARILKRSPGAPNRKGLLLLGGGDAGGARFDPALQQAAGPLALVEFAGHHGGAGTSAPHLAGPQHLGVAQRIAKGRACSGGRDGQGGQPADEVGDRGVLGRIGGAAHQLAPHHLRAQMGQLQPQCSHNRGAASA